MDRNRTGARAIIVLGMHRGGTSSATRGLECLGVNLGEDLLPSLATENPRGFYEDVPLLELSDRVLDALGLSWDAPDLIHPDVWQNTDLSGLELEATQSIRHRFGGIAQWGFKNPRTARLLPFWQRVFSRAGRKDAYVLVVRNPLSVAKSLEARNGFSPAKSYLLWLLHMTDAVLHTRGKPRVCVDYDQLLADPPRELGRISAALDLPNPESDPDALNAYADGFLTEDHRNSHFEAPDLELEADLSVLARRAHTLLHGWARDEDAPSKAQLQRGFLQIQKRLEELAPLLAHLSDLDTRVEELQSWRKIGEESQRELQRKSQRLDEREAELGLLRGELAEQRELLELWEVDMASTRAELGATQAGLAAAQGEAADFQTELQSHQETIAGLTEDLRSEVAENSERVVAHKAELERLGQEHHGRFARQEERRRELETILTTQLSEAAGEKSRLESEVAAQRHEIEARWTEVESQRQAMETHRIQMIHWLHAQTTGSAARLLEACQVLRASTTWRWASRIQRFAARPRLRTWSDGSLHLYRLVHEFHEQSQKNYVLAESLSGIAGEIERVLDEVLAGRIFRTIRRAVSLSYQLRFKSMTAGPVELLRSHVGEVSFFLKELSHAPFESAVAPPAVDKAVVDRCVDVIIPVFEAREQTLRCIDSVLRSQNQTPFELIVVDDASHDRKLKRSLDDLFEEGAITLLRNEENLGFPRTANRGLALHVDRDVVLLNSDALVHGNWLDRLRRSAVSDWNVATVTPFSNNGEICSYPKICEPGVLPAEQELAELDRLAASANAGLSMTLPTAVGFCTYIRRHVMNEIGYFNEEMFQRGYGEENEFCLRARSRGYRDLLAADVFVAHEGGASFLDSKEGLIRQGLDQLGQLYPEYEVEVHRFIASDPIRWLRQRLEIASLSKGSENGLLMINHGLGGGTERHVSELSGHLEAEGTAVWTLQPDSANHVRLFRDREGSTHNLSFDLPADLGQLVEVLRLVPIRHVHIHHLLGMDPIIRELPEALGVSYDVSVHDYFAICPRVNLVDDRDSYCGVPDAETCTACVVRNGSEVGSEVDVAQWREDAASLLTQSRRVYAPSQDVLSRMDSLLPGVNWRLRPHPEEYEGGRSVGADRPADGTLRIAVIGAIGFHKGSRVLLECAIDAAKRDLPLEFHVVGYTDLDDELFATGKVSIGGAYRDEELQTHLAEAGCHVALLPSVWPETFCYTLSAALAGELYPVAFDLGAIAERIRALGWGELLPIRTTASELNDHLLDLVPPSFPSGKDRPSLGTRYENYLVDYYDDLKL